MEARRDNGVEYGSGQCGADWREGVTPACMVSVVKGWLVMDEEN